ncbi:hypothetical protein SynRS9902_01201 [Synechococcus sp. RS9902]|nr:hypothetical protein SynRS9902_01201 [Synechococcus sp. RS9902]
MIIFVKSAEAVGMALIVAKYGVHAFYGLRINELLYVWRS